MSKTPASIELTPEQRAAHEEIRERFRREQPSLDDLIDRGEIDEPVPHRQFVELRSLMARLRERRQGMGVSLTDLSETSGLTRAVISRLENGWNANPTLETLFRYSEALGVGLKFDLEESQVGG